jgi:hypothetical protein
MLPAVIAEVVLNRLPNPIKLPPDAVTIAPAVTRTNAVTTTAVRTALMILPI